MCIALPIDIYEKLKKRKEEHGISIRFQIVKALRKELVENENVG